MGSCISLLAETDRSRGEVEESETSPSPKPPDAKIKMPSQSLGLGRSPTFSVHFRAFSYNELVEATGNFKKECEISDGARQATNVVYRGQLTDGSVVAIKRFHLRDWPDADTFMALAECIGKVRVDGFVSLLGACNEGSTRLLVAEYMPGSLTRLLFHWEKKSMTWLQRIKAAARAAKTLEVLEGVQMLPSYHDLTVDRVLFSSDGRSHLSSFGIMKAQGEGADFSMNMTDVPPEFITKGTLVKASVVWSFGTLLLALLSGKSVRARHFTELVEAQKTLDAVVDSTLRGSRGMVVADVIALVASCLQQDPGQRPALGTVLDVLNVLQARAQGNEKEQKMTSSRFGQAAASGDLETLHELLVNQMYGTPPEPSFEYWKEQNASMQELVNARSMGDKAFRVKNWEEAILNYTKFTKLGTSPLHLMFARRALCYLYVEKYRLALADAMTAEYANPTWPEAFYLQAVALNMLQMGSDAKEIIAKGLRHEQQNSTSQSALNRPQQSQSSSFRF